ncbi:hypothetical protein ACFWGC_26020 [Cytobacillus pseudoceanisediminis]|uniref:hypothetical protein n=2 Tax=Bacillati TaxID=1783272 RepID=UPI0036586693
MARPKKVKKPGDQIPLKLKENEPEHIVAWFNTQDSIAASLRYLIEKDIIENGIRDVKEEILNSFLHYKPHFQQAPGVVSGTRSIIEEETNKESTLNVVGSMPPHKNEIKKNDTKIEEMTEVSQNTDDENHEMSKQGVSDTHQPDSPKPPNITSNENKVDDDLDIDELNIFG